jgi:hypothetical protein
MNTPGKLVFKKFPYYCIHCLKPLKYSIGTVASNLFRHFLVNFSLISHTKETVSRAFHVRMIKDYPAHTETESTITLVLFYRINEGVN